jgi:hypothetical protein
MPAAEQDQVREVRRAAVGLGHDVMSVARDRLPSTPGERTVPVSEDEGVPLRGVHQPTRSALVQDLRSSAKDERDDLGVASEPTGRCNREAVTVGEHAAVVAHDPVPKSLELRGDDQSGNSAMTVR